jgi:hypothetical protein
MLADLLVARIAHLFFCLLDAVIGELRRYVALCSHIRQHTPAYVSIRQQTAADVR